MDVNRFTEAAEELAAHIFRYANVALEGKQLGHAEFTEAAHDLLLGDAWTKCLPLMPAAFKSWYVMVLTDSDHDNLSALVIDLFIAEVERSLEAELDQYEPMQ